MKIFIQTTLFLSVLSTSLFAAQPYKVKKAKHQMVQSPTIMVKDMKLPVYNTTPIQKIEKECNRDVEKINKESSSKAFEESIPSVSNESINLSSVNVSSLTPSNKAIKKAKRIQKKLSKKSSDDFPISNNQVIAIGLCLFLFFVHRIYLGYYGIAILQLITLGGFGIWWLIDLIRLFTGDLKPKNGNYDFKI